MLDMDLEIALRDSVPAQVRCFTGDGFKHPDRIRGDESRHPDALLGIFDGIARVAAAALPALDDGDTATHDRLFEPTVPMARRLRLVLERTGVN